MGKFKVELVSFENLPQDIKDEYGNLSSHSKYSYYILVWYDGELINCFSDSMEPEDATFTRDLNWISQTIKDAYQYGLKDGRGN